jgi:hypothetical protein
MHRCCGAEMTRRDLLRWAILGAGAWVTGPILGIGATPAAAIQKGEGAPAAAVARVPEWIQRHAARKDNPWALMHAVRALGKGLTIDEGPAADYLCAHFLEEKEVGGRRYLFMPEVVEGHANTFLKTLLEAGLPLDHPFTAVGRRHTVGDLVTSAKKLFSFDPDLSPLHTSRDEIAWSIIAFSITTRPGQGVWTNAEGREVRFQDVVAAGFSTAELASADFRSAMEQGRMPSWKDRISNFTCGGTHLIYSLAVAVRYGHLGAEGRRRLGDQLSLVVWRLQADLWLLDRYYEGVAKAYPKADAGPLYKLDARLKFLGHAFEVLSYARQHQLFSPSPAQRGEIQNAQRLLEAALAELQQVDMMVVRKTDTKLDNLFAGDACHAYHGIHMVRGVNQV